MKFNVPKKYFDSKYFSTDVYDHYKEDVLSWVRPTGRKINSFLKNISEPKILDVGCAHGFLLAELKNKYNANISGLEYSDYAIKSAEKSVRNSIKKGNILQGGRWPKSYFDAVICFDVFEYLNLKETRKAAQNLVNWAKNYLFFTTLYKHSQQNSQKLNPDQYRVTALSQKEYIKTFLNYRMKFITKFNSGSGGDIMVFTKDKS